MTEVESPPKSRSLSLIVLEPRVLSHTHHAGISLILPDPLRVGQGSQNPIVPTDAESSGMSRGAKVVPSVRTEPARHILSASHVPLTTMAPHSKA